MSSSSTVLVGLGNPDVRYAHTRHNIGFMVLDAIAHALPTNVEWRNGKHGLFTFYRYVDMEYTLFLIKPLTFMNRSGHALVKLSSIGIDSKLVTVIYDNLDLPLGNIKLKVRGGTGGHNGIASIIDVIGNTFQRVSIGIGRPEHRGQVHDFVLGVPPADEQDILLSAIQRVCSSYIDHPLHTFAQRMEYLHRRAA